MARDRSAPWGSVPASPAADYPTGKFQSRGGYLGLCNADLSENFIAILVSLPALLFRARFSDRCRNICSPRGCNCVKQQATRVTRLRPHSHFTPPRWFLILSLIGTSGTRGPVEDRHAQLPRIARLVLRDPGSLTTALKCLKQWIFQRASPFQRHLLERHRFRTDHPPRWPLPRCSD